MSAQVVMKSSGKAKYVNDQIKEAFARETSPNPLKEVLALARLGARGWRAGQGVYAACQKSNGPRQNFGDLIPPQKAL